MTKLTLLAPADMTTLPTDAFGSVHIVAGSDEASYTDSDDGRYMSFVGAIQLDHIGEHGTITSAVFNISLNSTFPEMLFQEMSYDFTNEESFTARQGNFAYFAEHFLAGDDIIQGSDGDDKILGFNGADTVQAGHGLDIIDGGLGDDLFVWKTGDGNDNVDGGDGLDVQEVNGSNAGETFSLTTFFSGPSYIFGIDSAAGVGLLLTSVEELDIRAGGGNDSFTVPDTAGLDLTGVIKFWGGLGNDALDGRATGNTFIAYGDAGADSLRGGRGGDSLNGGDGNDVLRGSRGADALNGGAGDDVFVYKALNESGTTAGHRDQISGFASGDRINIHSIDAKAGGANDDFVLDTNNSFSEGEIRQTVQNGNLRLDFNADADAQADMSIVLLNHTALLSSGDFVL